MQLLLHRQCRVKRALGMVLMGHRGAEQCENSVARRLRNVAAVAMYRLHHKMQHRVDDRARLLGIEVAHHLGRILDVGEQRGDGLALALDCFRGLALGRDANARLNRNGLGRCDLWLGGREAIAAFAAKL
jgi:hypothetical protein